MKIKSVLFVICSAFITTIIAQDAASIIPKPISVKYAGGKVAVQDIKTIVIPKKNAEIKNLAADFAKVLGLGKYSFIEQSNPAFPKSNNLPR